jgi:hypothetical protein
VKVGEGEEGDGRVLETVKGVLEVLSTLEQQPRNWRGE